MEILQYREKFKDRFAELNLAWIEKYFEVEEEDRKILSHPETFLDKGAMIYFAAEEENMIACCMVLPLADNVWELCKFATDENYRGRGAGSAVFAACMDYAIKKGAKKIVLDSNHILTAALRIYEKFGFNRIPTDSSEYRRTDVQYEYIVPSASGIG